MKLFRNIVLAFVLLAQSAGAALINVDQRRVTSSQQAAPITAVKFVPNGASDYDFGLQEALPTNFCASECSLRFRVRLISPGSTSWGVVDVGDTAVTPHRRWSDTNTSPYSSNEWWWRGNFLLDGHNNTGNDFHLGTYSIQVVDSGRLRWLFGDGAAALAREGRLHAVTSTTALLDGQWHQVALVRRNDEGNGSILEVWIDGIQEGTETTSARTNMWSSYWDDWSAFPSGQQNWTWGSEKQAANGDVQWEDAMFDLDELAFFGRALNAGGGAEYTARITGSETGLLGYYLFDEQNGTTAARSGSSGGNITFINPDPSLWVSE